MTTVFETTDVYEWWKVKKALKAHHIVVHDCRIVKGDSMLLEVRTKDAPKATMIIKQEVKT